MAKYLVIVESPAKVKTIKKFLGKNYEVMASNGHVRDLPKSSLGIDVDGDFEPKYITIRGKGEILAKLRKEAKKADKIYLATDPDREGEAISWHLLHALKLEGKDVSRISFNEITKNAVKESLKHPRKIDMDLVDAQQARRVLDRIVRCFGPRLREDLVREECSLLHFALSVTGRMKSMHLSLRSTGALMPRLMWRVRRSQSLQSYTAGATIR